MVAFKLPQFGENVDTAEVTRLLVAEGDVVRAEQAVMELESEKASFPLPCPYAGKVAKLHVKEGDTISVGQTVLEIDEAVASESPRTDGQSAPAAPTGEARSKIAVKAPASTAEKAEKAEKIEHASRASDSDGREAVQEKAPKHSQAETPPKGPAPARSESDSKRDASRPPAPAGPATRRLARELGVDLFEVAPSQPGRITREDVKAHVRKRLSAAPGLEAPRLPDFQRWGPVRRQRLGLMARTAAGRLSAAWRIVPHVTQHELADVTDLETARELFNKERGAPPKITVTVLALRAVVAALKAFPHFNSSLDAGTGELIIKEYYHIGVAVDTEQGLLVPVLRDVDRKSVLELAAELTDLADKARRRALTPQSMEGGTFTISNLGGIGGAGFTPIVNYPEVAILGIARARWQPVVIAGNTVNRLMLPLSLSYDHRVINGADGARFVGKIAQLLAGPFQLLAAT
jgi:pyruvate dehydrogenase E2 component (dihydrolipoamide acetyltransferase)